MITSPSNPKVQFIRALQSRARNRRKEGAFVVEGVRLAEEALAAGWPARLVLHTRDLDTRGEEVVHGFAQQDVEIALVDERVMQAAADTVTPQGILAVLSMQTVPLPQELDFVLISDGVRDPGNMGTMLRTAAAAGVRAFLLPSGTVDPFSPKVVRAAMGAHFRIPILALSWEDMRAFIEANALYVHLAMARAGEAYTEADFRRPTALIVGGEAEGAGASASTLAHKSIHIPMPGKIESLNAAVAAAILMFEVVRQRSSSHQN
jgi:TrmH family RNA methyltransferase